MFSTTYSIAKFSGQNAHSQPTVHAFFNWPWPCASLLTLNFVYCFVHTYPDITMALQMIACDAILNVAEHKLNAHRYKVHLILFFAFSSQIFCFQHWSSRQVIGLLKEQKYIHTNGWLNIMNCFHVLDTWRTVHANVIGLQHKS